MKKAKIMLSAIAMLAVIGGALAFKAKTFGSVIYTTTSEFSGALCPFEKDHITMIKEKPTPSAFKISVTDVAPTNAAGEPCVLSYTKGEI